MLVLALDTSTTVRAALAAPGERADDGGRSVPAVPRPRVLAARTEDDPRRHVELLAPAVAVVLSGAGVSRREVTHVVVGTGPAPFTGLRVGVVTALVLAEALGVPVGGVCSLDAVAATAVERSARAGAPLSGQVVAATDAKRREVHWARYAVHDGSDPFGGWERLDGPRVGPPGEVPDLPVVGGGAVLVRPTARTRPDGAGPAASADRLGVPDGLDPGVLAALAVHRLIAGVPLEDPEPRYLRRPDARPMATPA